MLGWIGNVPGFTSQDYKDKKNVKLEATVKVRNPGGMTV
jgi:hypothetical protein